MASSNEGYTNALLALSGNPTLAHARDALFASISDQDLRRVLDLYLQNLRSRQCIESALRNLFDNLVKEGTLTDDTSSSFPCTQPY